MLPQRFSPAQPAYPCMSRILVPPFLAPALSQTQLDVTPPCNCQLSRVHFNRSAPAAARLSYCPECPDISACADFVAAKVAELLCTLLGSPWATARFVRAGLLPQAVLASAGFRSLLAGRTRLTGASVTVPLSLRTPACKGLTGLSLASSGLSATKVSRSLLSVCLSCALLTREFAVSLSQSDWFTNDWATACRASCSQPGWTAGDHLAARQSICTQAVCRGGHQSPVYGVRTGVSRLTSWVHVPLTCGHSRSGAFQTWAQCLWLIRCCCSLQHTRSWCSLLQHSTLCM